MLIGEYKHTIDTKKRVSLPSKFRKEMGEKVVITHGFDKCLFVYTMAEWEKLLTEKISQLSIGHSGQRDMSRFLLTGAFEAEIDSIGRILVPDSLREYASLNTKVVVTGVYSHIEIWDEEMWSDYKKKIENQADVLAEKLGEMGVI